MSLDKATVARIATLARLRIADAELESLTGELSKIVDWVERLDEVDTAHVAPGLRVASPLTVIARKRFADDARRIALLMAERKAGGLVVGLPLNMDGSEGPMCQSVRQFAANLIAALGDMPIAFWDERLSTAAVDRAMLEADLTRQRRAKAVDKLAATYILQGLLDRLRQS